MIRIVVLALASAFATAALAAGPVFPPGSRIGLTPPKSMALSKRFTGFEDPAKGAALTLIEMPGAAYGDVARGMTEDALKAQGLRVRSREEIKVGERSAVLVSGEQTTQGATIRKWLLVVQDPTLTAFIVAQAFPGAASLPDGEMRAALETVAIRAPLPIEEQIASLPFRIGDRSGFRPIRTVAGNSLLLTEGPKDVIAAAEQPMVIVAQSSGPAPPAAQRDAFARSLLAGSIVKDIVYERSQAFRQKGADWHEIVARATDAASGQAVVVTQAIRFAPDHYVRMLGVIRADTRTAVLPRLRRIFDGVEPK